MNNLASKEPRSLKVIEFKAYPSKAALEQIEVNRRALQLVWNECLAIRLEERHRYQVAAHGYPVPFGLRLKARMVHRGKKSVKRYTGMGVVRCTPNGKPCAPRCPIRTVRSPMAERMDADPKLLNKVATLSYWKGHPLFDDPRICTRFMGGMSQFTFKAAWDAYLSKTNPAAKPKFKSFKDLPRTLMNASGNVKAVPFADGKNGEVIFPKGLRLRVKGLFTRLTAEHSKVAIVVRPSGVYVQFCVPSSVAPLPPSSKAVGIDPGVNKLLSLSNERQYEPNAHLAVLQKRLKRLQRKLSRQKLTSASRERTRVLIAKLHEKISRSRSAYNHKLSTKIVRQFGAIAIEDTKLKNMTRKVKPKESEEQPGVFLPNGASAKSGLNRAILDRAIGDFRTKLETKARVHHRQFVKVAAHHTSQTCNACGAVDPLSRKGRIYRCTSCGHMDDADINAAKNILSRAAFL